MKTKIVPWEIIGESYAIVRANMLRIVGRYALVLLFFISADVVIGKFFILSLLNSTIFSLCTALFGLTYAEGGSFTLDTIITHLKPRKFLNFFLVVLVTNLAIFGGFILLVIPALIVAIMLRMTRFIAIEKKLSIREVLAESVRMTKGYRVVIFKYMALSFIMNIVGFFCAVIGVFFTLPITVIGIALIYKKISADSIAEVVTEKPVEAVATEVIEKTDEVERPDPRKHHHRTKLEE